MLTASCVAKYFVNKDANNKLFSLKVVQYNGRNCYEGNVRLNKYLFLSQVVYMAKYGKKLFDEDFQAYENGPVVKEIVNSFQMLIRSNDIVDIPDKEKTFLDKIYFALENATNEELIDITHEDPEWIKLSSNTYNAPVMHLEDHLDEYKKRYKGIIEALDI